MYYAADGTSQTVCGFTENITLYAHWTKDAAYDSYTYISTYSDLRNMSANGKYLLINDINMNGNSWTPIRSFSGTFDGGCHSVYNFRITNGIAEDGLVYNFGLFGWLQGKVVNLQVGDDRAASSVYYDNTHLRYNAGMIAGYCTGQITNCRVRNCSINLKTFAQDEKYGRQEFWINAGGICGNAYQSSISRCSVENTTVDVKTEVRYNVIHGTSRAAGAVGFANSSNVSDCLVRKCKIYAFAKSHDGALANWSGKPHARAGCIIATSVRWGNQDMVISRCVEAANSISANKEDGWHTANEDNNTGTAYAGAMIGETNNTSPSDLIGVLSGLQCSGTNSNFPSFTKITVDSYSVLINTSSAFSNGNWESADGKISVKFYN